MFTFVNNRVVTFVNMENAIKLTHILKEYKEQSLRGRYISPLHIEQVVARLKKQLSFSEVGTSLKGRPIFKFVLGSGPKKILLWSQMHGNESTTTKAVFDAINYLLSDIPEAVQIRRECQLHMIPMFNPDGAMAYTRVNGAGIDLNRDAQALTQPESNTLLDLYTREKPDYCFNMHDQRTIFGVGATNKPATISFLTPAADISAAITPERKTSMELIAIMNEELQKVIPGQVGRYDDTFNINCMGDTFQNAGTPTILFEAGHYPNDYEREKTRELIFLSLIKALSSIASSKITGASYKTYFDIPENQKTFFDVLIKRVPIQIENGVDYTDLGILYKETLKENRIEWVPYLEKTGDLSSFFGHAEFDAKKEGVLPLKKSKIDEMVLMGLLKKLQKS